MTSGNFHSIPVDSIIINREERQRRELANIPDLAESISRRGLIHPIVVTRDHVLVAGERRLSAVKSLGWTHITAQFTDELDPTALRAIELEENIKRLDISWQDQCRAVDELHRLMKETEQNWSQEKTAKLIGVSAPDVNYKLRIADEIKKGNTRVIEAPKLSVARGIIERSDARKTGEELKVFEAAKITEAPVNAEIKNEDFLSWSRAYRGPKFNFIHCDFPYGIGADTFNQGSAPAHGGYGDTVDTYLQLIEGLRESVENIAAESCHIMFWFSMHYYGMTYDALTSMGFEIDKFPLIWMKTDNVGILPDPSRGPRRIYETALFGSRGDRKIVQAVANAYGAPTVRERHMSEKPEPMLRHFFRMFVDENSVVLDPTCGSGSAVRAAEGMKARYALGLEVNDEFASRAQQELQRARTVREAAA